jgi:hypothetical protein
MDHVGHKIKESQWQAFAVAKARLLIAVILAKVAKADRCPKCNHNTQTATAIAGERVTW